MLTKINLGLKLAKYGFNIKQNIVCAIIFATIGAIVEIASKGTNVIGAFYLVLIGMFIFQMITSMGLSNLVASSKLQKSLQTSIPVFTNLVVMLLLLTVTLIIKFFIIKAYPELTVEMYEAMGQFAIMSFLMFLFCGACYKLYLVATIVFVVLVMFGTSGYSMLIYKTQLSSFFESIGFGGMCCICYATFIFSALCQYLILLALYKKPLSKSAFKSALQKM